MALIKCYECGQDVSTTATACAKCGAPQNVIEKTNCIACGLQIAKDSITCSHCNANQKSTNNHKKKEINKDINTNNTGKYIQLIALLTIIIVGAYGIYRYQNRPTPNYNTYDNTSSTDEKTNLNNAVNELKETTNNSSKRNNQNGNESEKAEIRNNWRKYIVAETYGDYKLKVLGGISGLRVKITNNTKFKIDKVVVSVDIIKSNGQLYSTEKILFANIGPYKWYYNNVPETPRGSSFRIYISEISSTSLGL